MSEQLSKLVVSLEREVWAVKPLTEIITAAAVAEGLEVEPEIITLSFSLEVLGSSDGVEKRQRFVDTLRAQGIEVEFR